METSEREVRRWLLALDSRDAVVLPLEEIVPIDALPKITGREVDHVLQQAVHDGSAAGERQDRGDAVVWARLRLTVAGLRELGEWPPDGGEYRAGPWDQRRWGRVSRPLLRELHEDPPHDDVKLMPTGGDDPGRWQEWTDLLRLLESGLIQGQLNTGHLQDIRVTRQGHAALDPPVDAPLTRARTDLDRGAKADAVTAAIDEALKPVLHRLADAYRVDRTRPGGKDVKLAVVNDGLKTAGAYDESHRAEISSWLKVRNIIDHGGGATVRDRRVERLIDGVEGFIEEMSSA
jgi:hypothetical protein